MTAAGRVGAFAVGVAALFAGAYALGAAVGPDAAGTGRGAESRTQPGPPGASLEQGGGEGR